MTAAGNGSASETDISPADRGSGGRSKNQPSAIKTLFRSAVKALTRRDDDEPPPTRRRRGDTDKAFTMTARAVLRRALRFPVEAYAVATDFLFDTLEFMHLWSSDIDHFDNVDVDHNNSDNDYTSLHL